MFYGVVKIYLLSNIILTICSADVQMHNIKIDWWNDL